jgi:hypothetical protein
VASGTLIAARERSALSEQSDRGPIYRCECRHVLRVYGGGRHRVYFEPDDVRFDDPVMNGACPQCGRGLPGKDAHLMEPACACEVEESPGAHDPAVDLNLLIALP